MIVTSQGKQIQAHSGGEEDRDPLLLDKIYRNPLAAFLHQPKSVEDLKGSCLIFLDTNVLLIPYSTSNDSLRSLTEIYKRISDEGRLYLADRVMQEFEKNVPEQIKKIFHNLVLGQNYNAQFIDFPLLDGLDEYISLKAAEKSLREKFDEYRKATKAVLEKIESWNHNDPVRSIYRSVFANAKRASITSIKPEQLLLQWKYRLENKIPPGYKDGGKSDSGIGDYLLWQAVIDTCAADKKSAIVVSSDAKADWWHQTDNQSLYARRELVEEFRAATGGETVMLLSPADFLKLFGATNQIVEEVALEQAQVNEQAIVALNRVYEGHDSLENRLAAIDAAKHWLSQRLSSNQFAFEVQSRFEMVVRIGSKSHAFKFRYFYSSGNAVAAADSYAREESIAEEHTLVLIAAKPITAHKATRHFLKETPGINVIVGYISEECFLPFYESDVNVFDRLLREVRPEIDDR